MKSLLIVATVPGALSGFLLPFVKHFRSLGWRVEGMAQEISECDRCKAEFDRVWDVKWSRNPLDPRNLFIAAPRVREVIRQGDYDLVHVHTPVASFVTRYALRNMRQPYKFKLLYTAHGFHFHSQGSYLKNTIFLNLEKLAGNWTDYLITINKEDEAAANKYRLLPAKNIYYTPGIGVDTSYYHPDTITAEQIIAIRQELGLGVKDSFLLCVAEFTANKRHRDQLQALKRLNRPNVRLVFAGDGATRAETEALATQLGLQDRVHFLGFRSDIPALIRASNAVVLTSGREGLPRSIMEALCLATPVIGTNIRGIKDLLEDNCGLLVEVGEINTLTQAMAWIIDYPDEAIKMGRRGQQKMSEYDVQNVIEKYADLYDLAVKNKIIKYSDK